MLEAVLLRGCWWLRLLGNGSGMINERVGVKCVLQFTFYGRDVSLFKTEQKTN